MATRKVKRGGYLRNYNKRALSELMMRSRKTARKNLQVLTNKTNTRRLAKALNNTRRS